MAFQTALCPRVLLLQRPSAALLTSHASKFSTKISTKLCCRKYVHTKMLSVSRHFAQWSLNRRALKSVMKLNVRHGLFFGLVPFGAYFLLDSASASIRSIHDLCHLFLPWLKVTCQSIAVLQPTAQHQQQTVKQSVTKVANSIHKHILLFVQFLKLCVTFGPLLVLYPLTLLSSRLYSVWLSALFHVVHISGPVYIKLGQWASTRRDLFSGEFCELFSQLQYNVKPHAWHHTEKALCTAYGKQWYRVLKVDKTQKPLGSGCVAQVRTWIYACRHEIVCMHVHAFSLSVASAPASVSASLALFVSLMHMHTHVVMYIHPWSNVHTHTHTHTHTHMLVCTCIILRNTVSVFFAGIQGLHPLQQPGPRNPGSHGRHRWAG